MLVYSTYCDRHKAIASSRHVVMFSQPLYLFTGVHRVRLCFRNKHEPKKEIHQQYYYTAARHVRTLVEYLPTVWIGLRQDILAEFQISVKKRR